MYSRIDNTGVLITRYPTDKTASDTAVFDIDMISKSGNNPEDDETTTDVNENRSIDWEIIVNPDNYNIPGSTAEPIRVVDPIPDGLQMQTTSLGNPAVTFKYDGTTVDGDNLASSGFSVTDTGINNTFYFDVSRISLVL